MAVREDIRERVEIDFDINEPIEYRLILWNSDWVPFPFVIEALRKIGIPDDRALILAQMAHTTGKSLVGVYPYEIASSMRDEAVSFVHMLGATDFKMTIEENV